MPTPLPLAKNSALLLERGHPLTRNVEEAYRELRDVAFRFQPHRVFIDAKQRHYGFEMFYAKQNCSTYCYTPGPSLD